MILFTHPADFTPVYTTEFMTFARMAEEFDPRATICAFIYYPLSCARDFDESKRLLVAMQTADQHGVATLADWRPGDEVINPIPGSFGVRPPSGWPTPARTTAASIGSCA